MSCVCQLLNKRIYDDDDDDDDAHDSTAEVRQILPSQPVAWLQAGRSIDRPSWVWLLMLHPEVISPHACSPPSRHPDPSLSFSDCAQR